MTSAYTNVAKPTGANYTKIRGPGFHIYDDPALIYDQSDVSFDGGDGNEWIPVAKPTGSPYTKVAKPTT